MTEILSIFIGMALVHNLVLVQLLGVSSFMAGTSRLEDAALVALPCAATLALATPLNQALFHWILLPLSLTGLQLPVYVATSSLIASLAMLVVRRNFPLLLRRVRLLSLLVVSNSAVLGVVLLLTRSGAGMLEATVSGVGAAAGFIAVMLLFAALRERLAVTEVPLPFRGLAIELVTAGLAAMALLGLAGIV